MSVTPFFDRYLDKRGGNQIVAPRHVEYDETEHRWVSTPVRLYTGPRKALEVK